MNASSPSFSGDPRPGRAAAAEWIYRLLLRAYPRAFRADYGREMTQLFRDQRRMGDADSSGFWIDVVWDVARSAPALRMEAWRAHGRQSTRTLGGIMKLVAMLTLLLGLVGTVSAVAEGVAGVRQGSGGTYLFAVLLAVAADALLLVAGAAALRATPGGRQTVSRAAIASLVLFLLARAVFGWMSIFLQLVGVVLPLVILAALHSRRETQSAV